MSTTPTPPAIVHHFVVQPDAITVVGIELRTSNLEAMHTIPPHWQRFGQEGVLDRIAGRVDGDVLAVYTHFAHAGRDNTAASRRAVFPVLPAHFDRVGPVWGAVWAQTTLPKTFVAEYERYGAQGDISISIGLAH